MANSDLPLFSGYVHGTDGEEQQRLENLNAITNESFIEYLGLRGDESVCDFGCGLGYLDAQIAERFPGVCLNGIERCEEYCAIASRRTARHGGIRIVLGDVMSSGLPDEVFDVTFCRYLLEHVTSPQRAAREMVRVTKGGGRIIVQENDLHNVLYHPEIGGHREVLQAFCDLQIGLGGDPFIGRKLFSLFDLREVSAIDLHLAPEVYTGRQPGPYTAWISNSVRILRAAREVLVARGLVTYIEIDSVLSEMEDRIREPLGVAIFYWSRLAARKQS